MVSQEQSNFLVTLGFTIEYHTQDILQMNHLFSGLVHLENDHPAL